MFATSNGINRAAKEKKKCEDLETFSRIYEKRI